MATSQKQQGDLAAQDTTQVLQRIFTGHIVGQPAMGYQPLPATVVSATKTEVVVTITTFGTTATFTCYCQAQASAPSAGTRCFVQFPKNSNGYGLVVAFAGTAAPASGGAIITTTVGPPS